MKIQSFAYKNTFQGWGFDKIDFFDLTLLVGVSGVGKTQILRALRDLQQIANGKAINGIKWDISLTTRQGNFYRWQGEFEKIIEKEDASVLFNGAIKSQGSKAKIKTESIYINDDKLPILVRKHTQIVFNGQLMPKLSLEESGVFLFREEDMMRPIYEGFMKIIFQDHTRIDNNGMQPSDSLPQKIYKNLESVRDSNLDTKAKLQLVYELFPTIFEQIKNSFIDIFPQIEDVTLEILKLKITIEKEKPLEMKVGMLYFKEKNVVPKIPAYRMSSGMSRTFWHIAEILLCSEGTIILIDDLENSLGINCIDVLTEDLVFENKRIQFIATSHHPYIINKIPYEYWKIVTRRGGKIVTYDAQNFDLGDSRQERFMNLINLPQYRQGLADVE